MYCFVVVLILFLNVAQLWSSSIFAADSTHSSFPSCLIDAVMSHTINFIAGLHADAAFSSIFCVNLCWFPGDVARVLSGSRSSARSAVCALVYPSSLNHDWKRHRQLCAPDSVKTARLCLHLRCPFLSSELCLALGCWCRYHACTAALSYFAEFSGRSCALPQNHVSIATWVLFDSASFSAQGSGARQAISHPPPSQPALSLICAQVWTNCAKQLSFM